MAMSECYVAIIGAGPYGLAAAAHLRAANVERRVFGRAMEFWKNNMPAGMLLRSSWDASHIADPEKAFTLDRFHAQESIEPANPIPLETFINYGRWFQQRVSADLDERQVVRVETANGGFRLSLRDGDALRGRRVVVASGIASLAHH